MEALMAIMLIGVGIFMLFIAGVICSEMPAVYGVELIMAGFTAFLCAISGLMCFVMIAEMTRW